MNNLVKVIGEIVLTTLIIVIPMLVAFSFCLNWLDDTKFLLVILMIVDFIFVGTMIDKLKGEDYGSNN